MSVAGAITAIIEASTARLLGLAIARQAFSLRRWHEIVANTVEA
jgi:hypothetical protein